MTGAERAKKTEDRKGQTGLGHSGHYYLLSVKARTSQVIITY